MHNITLISTVHDEVGQTSSIALYKILLAIRPEVIFVEMPPSLFPKLYVEKGTSKLEPNAVRMYLEEFNAVTVPVDTDDMPPASFFREYQIVMERVLGSPYISGQSFRNLVGTKNHYASIYGFRFLNSDHYIRCSDAVKKAFEKELKKINDEGLNLTNQKWNELTIRRENEMIQNIYNYSRAHKYDNAVFLLGASHRKSTREKIEAYMLDESPKLSWVIYGD